MKRTIVITSVSVGLLFVLVWAFAQPAPAPVDLAKLVPPGPLLYLEAKDFGVLLRDWNSSQEKNLWLASDNFQVFSRSRLYLKLQQAQTEFATAAGVPPDMNLLGNMAGGQSAIAMYDIGALEFLYITRMPTDRFAGGALWKARGTYAPRQSAGIDYYIKTDPASRRVAAFAASKNYVVLATREDVIAGALALIAGQATASAGEEPWFSKTIAEAKAPGELRMVMNFEKLAKSPHFRSYWVQQNITEMKQYSGAIADAVRSPGELRENRVLIRNNEVAPSWNEAAAGEIVRYAPATAGVYRAWASPSATEAFDLIRKRLLDPRPDSAAPSKTAPQVALGDGTTGAETDLETRIDEPPFDPGAQPVGAELRKLLDSTKLDAMLSVGSTRAQPDGLFVGIDSGVALLAASNWDANAARDAVAVAFARLFSTNQAGARWTNRQVGAVTYSELDGLSPLEFALSGRVLLLTNSRALMEAMLTGAGNATAIPARYAAAYRHSSELPNFLKMMRLIDGGSLRQPGSQDAAEPPFLAANMGSLGQTLARVDSESIAVHDTGGIVTQNLVYKFK